MAKKKYYFKISKETLKNLYITQNYTAQKIADFYQVPLHKIRSELTNYNLNLKNKNKEHQIYEHPSKEVLENLYIKNNNTIKEISDLLGIPEYIVIYCLNKKYKIKKPSHLKNKRTTRKREQLINAGLNKEKLKELYRIEKYSPNEIGKMYNVSRTFIKILLIEYGIPTYSRKEANKIIWEKRRGKTKTKTYIHKKLDDIKKDIKNGKIKKRENL